MSKKMEEAVLERLRSVIDPETNTDVVRMRLVENLDTDASGKVRYTFRPSSFVCPIAVSLAMNIKKAVAEVPGVKSQEITVEGYMAAVDLEKLINQEI
ncbi:MAG: iron-sulfur cluster assembly protein [Anaerolineae bacterium]|jgi:metal-sulfur cluster biosynthetic enzyme|nr:iron-sulfur cluster assembly protein [Anaerolineae bacterium]